MIHIYDNRIFHLTDGKFSYAFVIDGGRAVHSYYGKAVDVCPDRLGESALAVKAGARDRQCVEIGEQGRGDFRIPSLVVRGQKTAATELIYVSHAVVKRPNIGMPALRGEAETLAVVFRDELCGIEYTAYYSVFDGALARHAEIKNISGKKLTLCTAASALVDLPAGDYELVSLNGAWGRECAIDRNRLSPGIREISSKRHLSSHQHNPFAAVVTPDTREESGEAFGFSLIYSGNFAIRTEVDECGQLRLTCGVDLLEGGITLEKGETFVTPEAVSVYSDCGLGGMSRTFHRLYRKRLIDPRFADKPRPIVVNSWESCYFDFDEARLFEFIDGAEGLGIDTVVLDDGWFGKRDSDNCSLGDWYIDRKKLPGGLKPIIDRCKQRGLKFGIWFEPEMISPDSDLYRAHPDYAIATADRKCIEVRNQYVLDFSRPEVVENVFSQMKSILAEYDISYVKWDANRPVTDIDDVKKYLGCVKGLYSLYEKLTAEFPHIIIEGCASGGGRFDPGILYYSPFIWTSDDTDALERTMIQYGHSLVYPLQAMSDHVSVCPNHQTWRTTPFFSRGAVASLGCLGYELNVARISEEERELIKAQTAAYRKDALTILNGDLYRLADPFTSGAFCEQVVSEDGNSSYLVFMRVRNAPNLPLARVRPRGLDGAALYKVEEAGVCRSGSELMNYGLDVDPQGDFGAQIFHINKIDGKTVDRT